MNSPLSEASPTSLDDLFSRDPLSLTRADKDKIIAELRAQRERWEIAERKPKKTPKAPLQVATNLEDLGL